MRFAFYSQTRKSMKINVICTVSNGLPISNLQDDALSVALLIPMPLQASRRELTDALSSHYGSPGRLANYRR